MRGGKFFAIRQVDDNIFFQQLHELPCRSGDYRILILLFLQKLVGFKKNLCTVSCMGRFTPAELQFDAGIYIQRHHGRNCIRLLIEQSSAAQQYHRKTGSDECGPYFLCWFFCCHIDRRSFPHFTAGENAAHIVWCSFFKG